VVFVEERAVAGARIRKGQADPWPDQGYGVLLLLEDTAWNGTFYSQERKAASPARATGAKPVAPSCPRNAARPAGDL
jgi:hypothetical protein